MNVDNTLNCVTITATRLSKMKIAFLLCFVVGGSFAFIGEKCDYSKCRDANPFKELDEVRFMPNAQQLREICPDLLRFLECNLDVIQICSGKTLNELSDSSNKSVAEATAAILGVGGLIRDLCNPHSSLHKDYVANIECFKGFFIVGTRLCQMESHETMEDFYEKSGIVKGGLDDDLNTEIQCLEMAYEVTCLNIRLGESCGETARKAFVTVVQRLKPLVDAQCRNGNGLNNLKSKFIDYMEVDDDQMSKIKETLDLFRRR